MKEFLAKEIGLYARRKQLSTVFVPQLDTKVNKNLSINQLSEGTLRLLLQLVGNHEGGERECMCSVVCVVCERCRECNVSKRCSV